MMQSLETVIGVLFVILTFSLVVSAAREVWAAWFRTRANTLDKGLNSLLDNLEKMLDGTAPPARDKADARGPVKPLRERLWNHPFILMLQPRGNRPPGYLPSVSIASALLHIAARAEAATAVTVTDLHADKLKECEYTGLATVIATVVEESGGAAGATLQKIEENLTKWVDRMLERITGLYQSNTRKWLFYFSLIMAALLNVDAIAVWQRVSSDEPLRTSLVAQAEKVNLPPSETEPVPAAPPAAGAKPVPNTTPPVPNTTPPPPAAPKTTAELEQDTKQFEKAVKEYQSRLKTLTDIGLPIGWSCDIVQKLTFADWIYKLLGIIITGLAASLGAPFWFDLLQKFINIRAAAKPLIPKPDAPDPADTKK